MPTGLPSGQAVCAKFTRRSIFHHQGECDSRQWIIGPPLLPNFALIVEIWITIAVAYGFRFYGRIKATASNDAQKLCNFRDKGL